MQLYLHFRNNLIVTDIITSDFALTEVYHNSLSFAENSVSIRIPYSSEIADKLKIEADNWIKAELKENGNSVYTGYLRKDFAFSKTQRNQPISLEILSPAVLLDVELENDVMLFNNTTDQIIQKLLMAAGFTNQPATGLTKSIIVFQSFAGDNIKQLIQELCFENGYVFDFDNGGAFRVHSLFNVPSSITHQFNGQNSLTEIKIDRKEREFNAIEAEWSSISLKDNTLLFSDTQNAADGNKCVIKIPANSYMFDTEENYLEYDSELGEVIACTVLTNTDVETESGITKTIINLGKRALMTARNTTSSEKKITRLDLYGNAYIKTATNISKTSNEKKKTKSYKLSYIHNKSDAEALIANIMNYYAKSVFEINLKSKTNWSVGSYVTVTDNGIGTITGQIIQKKTYLNKPYEYKILSVSDYVPATTETTTSRVSSKQTVDKDPPTTPVITGCVADEYGDVSLTFTGSTDTGSGVDYYNVYRRTNGTTYKIVAVIDDSNDDSYDVVNSTEDKNIQYQYAVAAVDKSGNISAKSEVATVTATVSTSPNAPDSVVATASEKIIAITWAVTATTNPFLHPVSFDVEISTDNGINWSTVATTSETKAEYSFGNAHPEASDLQYYKVRVRSTSTYGVKSNYTIANEIDTTHYGTWNIPNITQNNISAKVVDRTVLFTLSKPTSNIDIYGTIQWKVSIKRVGVSKATDEDSDDDYITITEDSNYYKPNLIDNPLTDETNYRTNEVNGYVLSDGNYSQTLPLAGQSTNELVNTIYSFRFIATNGVTESNAVTITVTALCTSIRDIVYANAHYKDLYVEKLSAISANIGCISQGGFGSFSGTDNHWALSDLSAEEAGTTEDILQGDFRVGGEDEYINVIPVENPVTHQRNYKVNIKSSRFEVTSTSAILRGQTILYDDVDETKRCTLNSNGLEMQVQDESDPTKWNTIGLISSSKTNFDKLITIFGSDTEDFIAGNLAENSEYLYSFTDNLTDQLDGNRANLTITGSIIRKLTPTGSSCLSGKVVVPEQTLNKDIVLVANGPIIFSTKIINADSASDNPSGFFNENASTAWGLTSAQVASKLAKAKFV